MADEWSMNAHLKRDCHLLGERRGVSTMLHRNAVLPWFILVPQCETQDLLLLEQELFNELMQQARQVASYIRDELGYPKINTASIGNMVPQLHLHVIGRKPDDLCWPNPVWGHLNVSKAYEGEDIKTHQVGLGF